MGLMAVMWRLGTMVGHHERRSVAMVDRDSRLEDATLALFGLLLGFTFSMSIAKHDARRSAVVLDSNAIGDFYTCASLLDEPVRGRLQAVVRDYVHLRVDAVRNFADDETLRRQLKEMVAMHDQMTNLVGQATSRGTPIAVSLTNTLNGLTSSHASRVWAMEDRLPGIIELLLFSAAAISTALVSRLQATNNKVNPLGMLSFILLITLVVYVVLDLNQPGKGMIQISQGPLERLLASMEPSTSGPATTSESAP